MTDTQFDHDMLRDYRAELRLTQEQLASMLGVNRRTIINWEQRNTSPSRLAVRNLAQHAGNDVSDWYAQA